MNYIWRVVSETINHLGLIYNLSVYEIKSKYAMHYLGTLWQMLRPLLQIGVFWFAFGIGIRGGAPVDGVPFFTWFIVAMIPWFFISASITQGANSIHSKINLASRMKFPVSALPAIAILINSFSFIVMLLIVLLIVILNGAFSGYYLLQLPYYLIGLYILLYGLAMLFSTLSIIIRDVQTFIQSTMRLMMFLLPIVWTVDKLPEKYITILKLNPFFYIIQGFRDSLLGGAWFFEDITYTAYFWAINIFILLLGSYMHLKFRDSFVDYL